MRPERPQQEEDVVPARRLLVAIAVTIVVTVGSVFWVQLVEGPPAPRPRDTQAGTLDRTLFPTWQPISAALLDAQRLRLASYGSVDREAGIVHIPIARAMQIIAAGGRP